MDKFLFKTEQGLLTKYPLVREMEEPREESANGQRNYPRQSDCADDSEVEGGYSARESYSQDSADQNVSSRYGNARSQRQYNRRGGRQFCREAPCGSEFANFLTHGFHNPVPHVM